MCLFLRLPLGERAVPEPRDPLLDWAGAKPADPADDSPDLQ